MAAHVTDGVSSPTPPVFDINSMLQAIALKDPRQRTPMDMEFLKWVQSGGKGAPPGVSTSKQIRPPSKPGASNLPSSKQAVESGIHRVQKLSPMSFQQISQEKWKDVPSAALNDTDSDDEEVFAATADTVAAKDARDKAKKELTEAMNRRLGMNMSALAIKRLRQCLVIAQKKHVDTDLLTEAKRLIVLVTGNNSRGSRCTSVVKSASRAADKAKYAAKETEIWESKNEHLVEKAEKRRQEISEMMKEKKDPHMQDFYENFHDTAGDKNNAKLLKITSPTTKLDNLFEKLGNLYSQTQLQHKQEGVIPPSNTSAMKSVNLPRQLISEKGISNMSPKPKIENSLSSCLVEVDRSSPISSKPTKSPKKSAASSPETRYKILPANKVHAYDSLLNELLAFGDDTYGYAENSVGSKNVTPPRASSKSIEIPEKKGPAKLRLHNAIALAASDRYVHGSDCTFDLSDEDEEHDLEEGGLIPSFALLESCLNQVDRARTQSRKLRHIRPIFEACESDRFTAEYSAIPFEARSKHYYDDSKYLSGVNEKSNLRDEALATSIADDFSAQVQKWMSKFPDASSTALEREQFAAFLDHNYLSSRLDPLAGTTHVRQIRRSIAKRIENIEKSGVSFDDRVKRSAQTADIRDSETGLKSPEDKEHVDNMDDEAMTIEAIEWKCKICSKLNRGDGKCIVCGRDRTADGVKTPAFIKAVPKYSVADRKGHAAISALSVPGEYGAFYAERKPIKHIHRVREKRQADHRKYKGEGKPPATWGGRHSESLCTLPDHAPKAIGTAAPIGYL